MLDCALLYVYLYADITAKIQTTKAVLKELLRTDEKANSHRKPPPFKPKRPDWERDWKKIADPQAIPKQIIVDVPSVSIVVDLLYCSVYLFIQSVAIAVGAPCISLLFYKSTLH